MYLPCGKWSGGYFSKQLKFTKYNGYKILVKKGYSFSKSEKVFNKYIEDQDLYKIKSDTNNTIQKYMVKCLLNNLLSRFGKKKIR